VSLIVRLEDQTGELLDGTVLGREALMQFLCDAGISRVVTDGASMTLDYGVTTRTIAPHLWTALVVRDGACRFPGCDRPPSFCEGHHVWHWEDGGPTNLANLVLLCSYHHHTVHKRGWQAKLRPDATFEVTTPEGRVRCTPPPGARDGLWADDR
jgi:hypothetical protein